jgi:hypothetical protein
LVGNKIMKSKGVISFITALACFLILSSGLHELFAGGRTIRPKHELSGSIVLNAWYRDSLINVAVCNISSKPHSLRIATGTYDVRKHIYASQPLEIPPNSIKLVYFPLLKRETPRGDLKPSDHVFLFADDSTAPTLMGFRRIQNIYPRYFRRSLDNFIVASGDRARFSFTMERDESLRAIFMAKSIKTPNDLFVIGEPAKEILRPASREEIKALKLHIFYEKEFVKQSETNYCYLIKPGEGGTINVVYHVPEIENCTLITIPVSFHIVEPPGGGGGGHGLTFMAYNPNVVQIKTLLELSTKSGKGIHGIKE